MSAAKSNPQPLLPDAREVIRLFLAEYDAYLNGCFVCPNSLYSALAALRSLVEPKGGAS